MAQAYDPSLPAALTLPISVTVRNSELNISASGNVSRLDERAMVAQFPIAIPVGTVLFTTIEMRSINASVRGLMRVSGQRSLGDGDLADFETSAEFVELNDDGRQKIERLLGRSPEAPQVQARNFAMEQVGLQPVYQRAASKDFQITQADKPGYFEPSPIRGKATATQSTKFWGSLGVTAYVAAFLILVALFPKGRQIELAVWGVIWYTIDRLWFWMHHVGDVKLYDNS